MNDVKMNMHNNSGIVSDALQGLPARGEKSNLHKFDKTAAESFCIQSNSHCLFTFRNYAEYAGYSGFSLMTLYRLSVQFSSQLDLKYQKCSNHCQFIFLFLSSLLFIHVKHTELFLCIQCAV